MSKGAQVNKSLGSGSRHTCRQEGVAFMMNIQTNNKTKKILNLKNLFQLSTVGWLKGIERTLNKVIGQCYGSVTTTT